MKVAYKWSRAISLELTFFWLFTHIAGIKREKLRGGIKKCKHSKSQRGSAQKWNWQLLRATFLKPAPHSSSELSFLYVCDSLSSFWLLGGFSASWFLEMPKLTTAIALPRASDGGRHMVGWIEDGGWLMAWPCLLMDNLYLWLHIC